jgi:hypothetical protein
MTSTQSTSLVDGVATQRARWRTLLERRKRFWRRILLLVLVTVIMVLVALANRDMLLRREVQKRAALVARALQHAYTNRPQDPPLRIPDLPAPYEKLHQDFYFNIFYVDQQATRPRVGVCCRKDPVPFLLRADGRVVILFDGKQKQFTAQWMTERKFRDEAPALGFDSSLLEK